MACEESRTSGLSGLGTGIGRVDLFNERTVQTVVIHIHSNDVRLLL